MAVISINATQWAMDMLRKGSLNRIAIKHRSVERACALFHAGAVYTFVATWRKGRYTMAQVTVPQPPRTRWGVGGAGPCWGTERSRAGMSNLFRSPGPGSLVIRNPATATCGGDLGVLLGPDGLMPAVHCCDGRLTAAATPCL